jgi:hypothetical protein
MHVPPEQDTPLSWAYDAPAGTASETSDQVPELNDSMSGSIGLTPELKALPTATQEIVEVQAMPLRLELVVDGGWVMVLCDHEDPFHVSARTASCGIELSYQVPTATQYVTEGQATPLRLA